MNDLQGARTTQRQFEEWKTNAEKELPIDLSVTVLTTGFWPTYKARTPPYPKTWRRNAAGLLQVQRHVLHPRRSCVRHRCSNNQQGRPAGARALCPPCRCKGVDACQARTLLLGGGAGNVLPE